MPDESVFKDKKVAVPVTCQQCGRVFWRETKDWPPPPPLCPMCEKLWRQGITVAQAMEELFDA